MPELKTPTIYMYVGITFLLSLSVTPLTMSGYFTSRISGAPKRILYAHNEHSVVETAGMIARDMALHGYLEESAMVIAPIWNSAVQGYTDFSLAFVRNTLSNFGLDLIWKGANFVPPGLDKWESAFDVLKYKDELIEIQQRKYFCFGANPGHESGPNEVLGHCSWQVIRDMLMVWEDPDTHIMYLPSQRTELDALVRLEAYINQGLSNTPAVEEYRPYSRFRWGEARPYAALSWEALLSEIEILESKAWNDEHEPYLPFFRPPASIEQITRVEQKLGVTLPQDYKEFLTISNGLGSFNRYDVAPLLSVDEIFWDTRYDGLKAEYRRFESDSLISQLPSLNRILQVTDTDEDQYLYWLLIEPSLIQEARESVGEDGPDEWLGATYAAWDPQLTHRGSFRQVVMMERRLAGLIKDEETQ
ncbi:SMI1 / KNR4 family [Rhizoctonia solani]|uniref:SMI1 / KNR4 family n=1 Tax=Rhizoctonia solani TaxID=456999 RepID=A0A8H7I890_9AGAM|nr:SMI1 / KNR4 family [Rhizoctonia solani]